MTNKSARTRAMLWPIVFAIAYFGCAHIALSLTSGEDGIAAVWPASGVYVAGLILFKQARRNALIIGVALGSLAANLLADGSFLSALGYTLANLVEGGIVLAVMSFLLRDDGLFARPRVIAGFTIAAFLASAVSAGLAALLTGMWEQKFIVSWLTTVLLGMLTVTPTILFVAQDTDHARRLISLPAFWLFIATCLASVAAFGQALYPLFFLPMVVVLFTTFLVGLSGASIALLIVAGIGSLLTAMGYGIVSQSFDGIEGQVMFFQVYLFALVISVLPIAVLLTRHGEDIERLAASKRALEAAEDAAQMGHWRYALASNDVTWSPGAQKVLGTSQQQTKGIDALVDAHHPECREQANHAISVALRAGLPFSYVGSIVRQDGAHRRVKFRTEVEFDARGEIATILGTLIDIEDSLGAIVPPTDNPQEGIEDKAPL
ncbi:MASE1 domain-containing protein [Erythrobacter sp. HKB08]|uniref:MASE1 domain-containing protein n=1 Tax=Erythrobacter sp. HKB08 TaxID=2502843 RepID=UPI0013E8BD29|nr:MASE1 domain-containing protein [Erythrobacter sp. HKB08]